MFSKLRDAHFMPSRPVLDLCHCGTPHKGESSFACDAGDEDLSPSQQESLHTFRDCLEDKGLLTKTIYDADLLRFLRARSFDIAKAITMYEAMLEWRKEVGADTIIESFQFLERKAIKELYPHFHHKTDKFGRPIYIERLGHLQLEEILKVTTMDKMLMYHIKEWEILIDWKFPACSKKAGRTIMQSLTILDVKGMAMKAMNKQVRSFVQKIAKIDQDYYPEYLGKMFIVNAPTAFKAMLKTYQNFLEAVVNVLRDVSIQIRVLGRRFVMHSVMMLPCQKLRHQPQMSKLYNEGVLFFSSLSSYFLYHYCVNHVSAKQIHIHFGGYDYKNCTSMVVSTSVSW